MEVAEHRLSFKGKRAKVYECTKLVPYFLKYGYGIFFLLFAKILSMIRECYLNKASEEGRWPAAIWPQLV